MKLTYEDKRKCELWLTDYAAQNAGQLPPCGELSVKATKAVGFVVSESIIRGLVGLLGLQARTVRRCVETPEVVKRIAELEQAITDLSAFIVVLSAKVSQPVPSQIEWWCSHYESGGTPRGGS